MTDVQLTNEQDTQVHNKFMTIPDFKAKLGIGTISVIKSPKSGKLFAETKAGNYKVQQNIDPTKPMRYMYEEDTFDAGCIVNVSEANVVATF